MLSSYRAQKRSDRKLIVSYTKPGAASVKDIYMSPLACKGGYILTDAGVCKVDAESRSDGIDCTPVQLQHLADQLKKLGDLTPNKGDASVSQGQSAGASGVGGPVPLLVTPHYAVSSAHGPLG